MLKKYSCCDYCYLINVNGTILPYVSNCLGFETKMYLFTHDIKASGLVVGEMVSHLSKRMSQSICKPFATGNELRQTHACI